MVFEIALAVALIAAGTMALSLQARRNRADMRALMERQSEALALQAQMAAVRARRRQSNQPDDKGTILGLRLY